MCRISVSGTCKRGELVGSQFLRQSASDLREEAVPATLAFTFLVRWRDHGMFLQRVGTALAMWSDNDTIEDLIGFRVHAELIRDVVGDDTVCL